MKSFNRVQSKSLILNKFNFEWWNSETNINLGNLPKEKKDINKKNKNQIWKEKTHRGWNCKKQNLKNDSKQNKYQSKE